MKRLLRSTRIVAVFASTLTVGCLASEAPVERSDTGRVQINVEPIDLSTLNSSPASISRVLSMPFVELAERFPAFSFESETEMNFTSGDKTFRQVDTHKYTEDDDQHFHASIRSADTKEINVWLKDGVLYVRHGKGQTRGTARRDIKIERWGELALSPVSQTFELFYPQLRLELAGDESFEGKPVKRFRVELDPEAQLAKDTYTLSGVDTRLAPVEGWRERTRPIDVSGFVLIEQETGVVVQSSFRGKLELQGQDADANATELTVRLDATLRRNQEPISLDSLHHVVDEVRRARPKKGALEFFEVPTE